MRLQQQMAIGGGDIHATRNDRLAILGRLHGERCHACEDGMELAWGMRRDMQHNQNCGGKRRGQAGDKGLQCVKATSGGAHDDNISVNHTATILPSAITHGSTTFTRVRMIPQHSAG